MGISYIKKNGLVYTEDLHTVVGIDSESQAFTGRIPFGAHYISDEAFVDCTCESISIPDSVKELPPCLFENVTAIKSVKLPSSLQQVSPYLFSGCTSLVKVTLPDGLTSFAEGLFYGCSSLQDVPFRPDIQELPENIFAGCTALKSVVIPSNVAKISSHAFANCTSLETIVIPAHLYELAEDAFEGCTSIRNIRVDGNNHLFYVNELDGCLYEKSIEGEDKCRLKICEIAESRVDFYEENLDDSLTSEEIKEAEEDDLDLDETFSAEIGVANEEILEGNSSELTNDNDLKSEPEGTEDTVEEQNVNEVDSIFADIMNDEKERSASVNEAVAISDRESEVLSEVMDVMADSKPESNNGAITEEELANLFSSNEANEVTGHDEDFSSVKSKGIDSKTQSLIQAAKVSSVIECEVPDDVPADYDLFVVAEKTVSDEAGNETFSAKLVNSCNKIAKIHGFRRIILLSGLPLDNEELMHFYQHFIGMKNVIVACEAASPSALSSYCKEICDKSRISLNKDDMNEQRKMITIKNDMLIKFIIQDKYN